MPSDLGYTGGSTYCTLGAASTTGFPWARIGLERELARGTGPFTSSAGVRLTVDNDKPTTIIALAEGQYFKAPASGGSETLIIGGSASDGSGVGVASVEVNINGVAEAANGTNVWAHPISMQEGSVVVQSIATDYLGNRGNRGRTVTIYGDGTPPTISANLPGEPIIPLRAGSGAWAVPIDASVQDPIIGTTTQPGSGEAYVEVLLQSADGATLGWQEAKRTSLAQNAPSAEPNWSLDYQVPDAVGDPTGSYTVTIRTADRVGNASERVIGVVRLITPDMTATIRSQDADLDPITDARPLAGALTSVTGIGSVEAAFVPIDQILIFSDTVLSLPLDEPAGSVWFSDASAGHHDASCTYEPCPAAGQPGRVDGAVQFSDAGVLEVLSDPRLDAFGSGSFTIQAWFKTGVKGGNILAKVGDTGLYLLWIDEQGLLNFDLSNKQGEYTSVRAPGGVASDTWTHVAAVVKADSFGGEAIVYLNGNESAYAEFDGDASNDAVLEIGIGFTGLIDDVMLINRALTTPEIRAFADPSQRSRLPVTLTSTGANSANWQITVPSGEDVGLEGFHQLDLFVTDSHGNRRILNNLWRGVIDTLPPRLTFVGGTTGAFYLDQVSGEPVVDVAYDLRAEDLHLDVKRFQALCTDRGQAERGYLNEPWVDLFPDLTVRDRLSIGCHDWATEANPAQEGQACDTFGHCTTVSLAVDTSAVRLSALQAGQVADPVIVWPPAGSIVAITDTISIRMAAASGSALREMAVMNMQTGEVFDAQTFTQKEGVERTVQTITFAAPAENNYDIGVRTTAWDGTVTTGAGVDVVFDAQAPTGGLITEMLTKADTFGWTSGIMRFSGVATDSMGDDNVVTVQVRINDGAFVDATVHGDGTWSTAQYVGTDFFGKSYTVTARIVDKAGHVTTDTKSVLVDIAPPPGYVPGLGNRLFIPLVFR